MSEASITRHSDEVDRIAEKAHRLAAIENATLWESLMTALSGGVKYSDVLAVVRSAKGDVELLRSARSRVRDLYPDNNGRRAEDILLRAEI